jgi:VanZ family protein
MSKFIYYTLPVIVWMIVIFLLSSRQKVGVSEEEAVNFLFFKTLHVIEYALLFALTFRAILQGSQNEKKSKKVLKYALVVSILYAISDEIHQTFVPTRQGAVRDVFIDLFGMLLMYTYINRNRWFVKQFLT